MKGSTFCTGTWEPALNRELHVEFASTCHWHGCFKLGQRQDFQERYIGAKDATNGAKGIARNGAPGLTRNKNATNGTPQNDHPFFSAPIRATRPPGVPSEEPSPRVASLRLWSMSPGHPVRAAPEGARSGLGAFLVRIG